MPTVALLWVLLSLRATALWASIPSDWVEYTPGTCNLVISSPHGGSMRVSEIADRTDGCLQADGKTCRWEKGCSPADDAICEATVGKDSFTQEIAALVAKHLNVTFSCEPHFVRSNLHRSRLDPNREIDEGAQGDAMAEEAWRTYHENYMVTAVGSAMAKSGRALVFDIHGQGHPEHWTELGYLLSKSSLNAGTTDLTRSSIRSLAARSGLGASELISGPGSFGSLLETRGYKAVPSPSYPSPGTGSYFDGGYTTERYGSRNSGEADAIQVEISSDIRLDQAKREKFAADLAMAIDDFRRMYNYKQV